MRESATEWSGCYSSRRGGAASSTPASGTARAFVSARAFVAPPPTVAPVGVPIARQIAAPIGTRRVAAPGVGARLAGALLLGALGAGVLLLTAPAPALAQGTDTSQAVPADSLHERLKRAEDAIDVLREQLATLAASSVQSATRVQTEIFGRVLANGFSNGAAVNNADVPLFVLPVRGRAGAGGTIRQTSLGFAVTVSPVLGGAFAGDLHTDFFGGQQPSTGGRNFPLLRIRTARGIVRWSRAELLFGQESPLVAGLNPVSVASFGTPGFVAAGNLWLWLPQLRITTELGTPARIAFQGAVLAPTSSDPAAAFDTDVDSAERSSRPYLQARLRARWGENDETGGEIGVGVHRGWVQHGPGRLLASEGVAVTARLPFTRFVELRGEAYVGRALRGLGGGGIGQNVTTTGDPVHDRGAWAQLNVRPSSLVDFGGGCGAADPEDDDLPANRLRNSACEVHLITRPGGPLLAGVEYRRLRTTYPQRAVHDDHVNLALGFEF
jgi:hypothetical protein